MAKIHFVDHSGETRTIDVENGSTVMETAIRNAIPGIDAECGGACACATCHVYVDEAWREKIGSPSPMEEDMLDFGFDVRPTSRLSCQIKVSDELDGLDYRRRSGRPETAAAIARASFTFAMRTPRRAIAKFLRSSRRRHRRRFSRCPVDQHVDRTRGATQWPSKKIT